MDSLTIIYNEAIETSLDAHARMVTKTCSSRKRQPWYNNDTSASTEDGSVDNHEKNIVFLDHCKQRHDSFSILNLKCGDVKCTICLPPPPPLHFHLTETCTANQ